MNSKVRYGNSYFWFSLGTNVNLNTKTDQARIGFRKIHEEILQDTQKVVSVNKV